MSALSPPRPAPRRTYGRARPASPTDDSAPSLFVSSTTVTSNVSVPTGTSIFPFRPANPAATDAAALEPEQSPSKSLLNRWTSNGSAWRKSLAGLDVPAVDTTSDDVEEDDAEELKREMERLRREARGLPTLGLPDPATVAAPGERPVSTSITKPATTAIASARASSARTLLAPPPIRISFSSDSLTDLPETSTPPPSSPPFTAKRVTHRPSSPDASGPQATSTEIDEETMPVVKSGISRATGRVRRILESDDEEEDENPFSANTTRDGLSPPPLQGVIRSRPSRVAISSEAGTDAEFESASVSETEHSPSPSPRKRPKTAETDEINDNTPRANHVQDFLATLADEDDAPEEDSAAATAAQMQKSSESIADPSGLFSDEEDGDSRAGKKVKGLKPLNKKEQKEMQKDMARARLERYVAPSRPEAERLPISSYLLSATKAIAIKASSRSSAVPAISAVPGLTFHGQSPASSTAHVTPVDEITLFTPSSNDAGKDRRDRSSKSRRSIDAVASSPTPQLSVDGRVTMVPGTSDGLSEDHELEAQIFDLEAVYDEDKVEKLAKQRRLEQTKRAVAQAQAARNKAKQPILNGNESDSDLDFEVLPDPVKSVAATSTTASSKLSERRRGPDAKAVLRRDNTVSAISKQRQDQLRLAGRSARHKDDDASETFVAFAARTFNHADLKRANGGAKPAERKAGRDRPVDAKSLDAMMKASHLRQVAAVQKKKEEDWGRARALPQRQEQDVEKLLDMTAKADARDAEDEENEEDEDGDYDPEDEDSADEVVQFSGEEDEEGAEVAGESEGDDGGSDVENDLEMSEGDKENVPLSSAPKQIGEDEDEDDEPVPLKVVRKARASNRAIVDSDDEEVTPRRPTEPRQPLSEVSAPARVDATPKGIEPTFVDLAGFGHGSGGGSGSGSGSPGFSQLFEATQAMGLMSGAADAFAGLRAAPQAGLLPAHALLPGVQISETQAERDNALVAGEADMEVDSDPLAFQPQPKAQYLNSQGLFTQTRPRAMPTPTHTHTHTHTEGSQTQGRRGPLAGRSDWSILGGEGGPNRSSSPSKETLETTEMTLSSPGKYSLPPPPAFSPTQGSHQFTRLKRRSSTDQTELSPADGAGESPASPSQPKQTDAFSALMVASHRQQRMEERDKSRPKRSALVDEQAEESDEDNGWLRPDAGEDENDDDEDDGQDLQDLVDDQAVNEEEKKRQDALAEEKRREIEKADDEKREAEARDVIEGKHRIKRKGQDFFSGDEDEENESGRRNWSKKMLKKRKLEREDGLHKLDGEVNVFVDAYEQDMDSDGDDIEEVAGFSDREREDSPPTYSARDAYTLVRAAAKRNRGKNLDEEEVQLDAEIAEGVGEDDFESFRTTTSRSRDLEMVDMEGDDEVAEMSQFSISRSTRVFTAVSASNGLRKTTSIRSEDNFQAYLQAESQTNRRVGPIGGVSVVSANHNNNNGSRSSNGSGSGFASSRPSIKPLGHGPKHPQPSRQSSTSSSASSILRSKTGKFA